MKLSKLFTEFTDSEKAGGLILIIGTIVSLCLANSAWHAAYINFWLIEVGGHQLVDWINDGLMSIFFLLVGLELEREVYHGEMSNLRSASLPVLGAIGGMLVPAGIYFLFTYGTATAGGAGIPMATDIAFAIGILSLLGKRFPIYLKVFLTALAVIDDLGAIIIIAIFYSTSISWINLLLAGCMFAILLVMNYKKVNNLFPYLLAGAIMWYFMQLSGIHPTISGVLLALAIPFRNGNEQSPSYVLQHILHKPVAFLILPLFAMANTAILIDTNLVSTLNQPHSIGIIMGLIIGKPLGIWVFCYLGYRLGFCSLPAGVKWQQIAAVGLLAGIGFTMSIFITTLAFNDPFIINSSKIAIMIASVVAGAAGFFMLKLTFQKSR